MLSNYLWCSKCENVSDESRWCKEKFKYGVCPSCGCSSYRNAMNWETIYKVNGYNPTPTLGQAYSLSPTLDI